jgi:hypothetical protein
MRKATLRQLAVLFAALAAAAFVGGWPWPP